MADTAQALVYEEAKRGVVQQQAVLDGVRTRAATLLGVASISTSFLGGAALGDQKPKGISWFAIAVFVIVGILTVTILLPWRGWTFRISARILIRDYVEAEQAADLAEIHRDLALHLEKHFDDNQKLLNQLFWLFRTASGLLVVEVVIWLFALS